MINPGTITENDVETLDKLKEAHELVITLEDGSLSGGFGEKSVVIMVILQCMC